MTGLPHVLAGFGVGILIGLTGMGGGSVLTPILVTVFGQSPAVSVGTDLAFAAGTKLVATAAPGFRARIDWPIVRRLTLGSLPAALLVLLWVRGQPLAAVNAVVLEALAVLLVVAAVVLLLRRRLRAGGLVLTATLINHVENYQTVATVMIGALLGAAVALTSVGAGTLGTVALVFLYPLRLAAARLVATDIALAVPLTLVAGCGHAALGHVDAGLLASLLLGSVPGVLLGSRLAARAPERLVRGLLAAALALNAGRLLAL